MCVKMMKRKCSEVMHLHTTDDAEDACWEHTMVLWGNSIGRPCIIFEDANKPASGRNVSVDIANRQSSVSAPTMDDYL